MHVNPHPPPQTTASTAPFVFSFDRNLLLQAEVTLSTLVARATKQTELLLYVLSRRDEIPVDARERLRNIATQSHLGRVHFLDVGDAFSDAFEVRGITIPTYYRLLLPDLLPQHDTILYLDVDTVICADLDPLLEIELGDDLLGGVKAVFPNRDRERLASLGITPGTYVNAGVLVMNLAAMRRENLQEQFLELAQRDFTFQDQDILNLTCTGRIRHLPPRFNVHAMFDYRKHRAYAEELFPAAEIDEALRNPAILHYAGNKPWNGPGCFFYDRWWEAYRESPAFNLDDYLDHQAGLIRAEAERAGAQQANTSSARGLRSFLPRRLRRLRR